MRKTRLAASIALTVSLGAATFAYADGASENDASVLGSVKPSKLDKKKYKPINLYSGVSTQGVVTGSQENPEQELISWGKNVKIDSKAAPTCSAPIEFQSTDAAKAACPKKSNVGSGKANIELPNGLVYNGLVVTVFNGPGKNEVRLHTYDQRLAGATPTVFGKIVKSKDGKKYGQALSVEDSPDVAGDAGKITLFDAKLSKKSGVALGVCKAKKFLWKRTVTYDDGSTETAQLKQKCKRKGGKKK